MLFFDLETLGHHIEYLYHIIDYRLKNTHHPRFIFVMHPDVLPYLHQLTGIDKFNPNSVKIIHPRQRDLNSLQKASSPLRRSELEFSLLHKILRAYNVRRCYLLHFNRFQFSVGLPRFKKFPAKLRGILFNPLGDNGSYIPFSITKFRKCLQLLWCLQNRQLEHLYILNNSTLAEKLNKRIFCSRFFISLPDPILTSVHSRFQTSNRCSILPPSDKCRYLLFGSISRRKGIFLLFEALKYLPANIVENIEIILAGKVVQSDANSVLESLFLLRKTVPNLHIEYLNHFLSYQDLSGLFSNVDCVLVPYLGNESSSGVLGHAAFHNKPVIGPARGLIGHLITSYQLGIALNRFDPRDLATAIAGFYKSNPSYWDTSGMELYVKEHSSFQFVHKMIKN